MSQPLVSHHLKELKRSLLVRREREGSFVYYELTDARILKALQMLGEPVNSERLLKALERVRQGEGAPQAIGDLMAEVGFE